jgi:DHA2 family multidrug resistance protein-like MFS transporter
LALFLLAVTAFVLNPITLYVPIYLQNVLNLDAFRVGALMMLLPLSTLIAGPVGGRLSDHYPPLLVAAAGVALLCLGVFAYARMDDSTAALLVVVPLVLTGVAGGLFRPANQVAAFATVRREDYGSVSAVQTSLMMLAGTLGTTVAVAISDSLTEGAGAASFAAAQRTTFLAFVPLLLIGVAVAMVGAMRERDPATGAALEPVSKS